MFHFQAKKLLTAYLDGELMILRKKRLELHIQTCAKCQIELNELKKLNSILDSLPKQEPRTGLYWQTQQKNILQKAQKPISELDIKPLPKPSRQIGWWKFALAGSTVMVACFVVWFNVYHIHPNIPASPERQTLIIRPESYYIDNNVYPHKKQPQTSPSKNVITSPQSEVQKKTLSKSLPEQNKSEIPALVPVPAPAAAPPSPIARRLFADTAKEKQPLGETEKKKVSKDDNAPVLSEAIPFSGGGGSGGAGGLSTQQRLKSLPEITTTAKSEMLSFGGSALGSSYNSNSKEVLGAVPTAPSIINGALGMVDSTKGNVNLNEKNRSFELAKSTAHKESQKQAEAETKSPAERMVLQPAFDLAQFDSDSARIQNMDKLTMSDNKLNGNNKVIDRNRSSFLSFDFKNADVKKALETLSTTAHIQILAISPQLDKKVTVELKNVTVDTALLQIGQFANLYYLTKHQNIYILTPLPFNLYTDKPGYGSSTNKKLLIPSPQEPLFYGYKYACPTCQEIILSPDWTYCPIDGSKIDKTIFKK